MNQLPGDVLGKATLGELTVRIAQLGRSWYSLTVYLSTTPLEPLYVERHVDLEELFRRYVLTREACVRYQEGGDAA